jgi:hypothetical protein
MFPGTSLSQAGWPHIWSIRPPDLLTDVPPSLRQASLMEKWHEAKLQICFDGRQPKSLDPNPDISVFCGTQALYN